LSRYVAENRSRKRQQKLEKTIAVKEHESEQHDVDPTIFYKNRFWNWRPDGIVINKNHHTLYILVFKLPSDRSEDVWD